MPALLTKVSNRDSRALKVAAASAIDEKQVRSKGKWMISQALGTDDRMSAMASRALDSVRAAR